jgi:hypothetical protein
MLPRHEGAGDAARCRAQAAPGEVTGALPESTTARDEIGLLRGNEGNGHGAGHQRCSALGSVVVDLGCAEWGSEPPVT